MGGVADARGRDLHFALDRDLDMFRSAALAAVSPRAPVRPAPG